MRRSYDASPIDGYACSCKQIDMTITDHIAVRLTDGTEAALRPVTPGDKHLLRAGFDRLSERSRYLRFLTPMPTLGPRQLAYLSSPDHLDHVALGLVDGDEPVGVGRWVRMHRPGDAADLAITVVDAYQGKGAGRALLVALASTARHRGVTRFHLDVLAENRVMLGLLERYGPLSTHEDGVVHLVVPVDRVERPPYPEAELAALIDGAAHSAG